MSRPYYDDGRVPEYYTQHHSPHQRRNPHPQSHIPRPSNTGADRSRVAAQMRPEHAGSSHGRSPRRVAEQQQLPAQLHGQRSPWQTSQNLYDGSAFDYQEDYGQYDQWPLPAPSLSQSPRQNGSSPRRPPPRPRRPDEQSPGRHHHTRPVDTIRALPSMSSPNRQYHQSPNTDLPHHGNGQWTPDGYVYAPPPRYAVPNRPLPSMAASPTDGSTPISAYPGPQMPEQVALAQANRRAPLGPPPSARRGPSSYYPQVGPVHPIVEETDSMRGSVRTAHTGGHDSKPSFASSNAIPIGISQLHLDHGREATAAHQPAQRHSLLSDYGDDDFDSPPTEPAIVRGETRAPGQALHRNAPSPEATVVRQASLGKKSKPTLTTVKSSNSVRKSNDEARGAIASLSGQQKDNPRLAPSDSDDLVRTEQSRALTEAMLAGHAQGGAPDSPNSSQNLPIPPKSHVREAPQYAASPHTHKIDGSAVATAAAYMKEAGFIQESQCESLGSSTDRLDNSSSEKNLEQGLPHKRSKELLGADLSNQLRPRSPLAPTVGPRINSILGGLEKGGALSADEAQELKQPMSGLSERSGKRRPPRLNVDAVRDAEARGSLTSLPDLIRRATKLASNLDRGKTASRMGMNWIDGAHDDEKRRSGGISDMLASFPPPAPDSRNGFRRSLATWSTKNRHSSLPSDSDAGERVQRRRCCGMPLWLFIVLLLSLLLLLAAAVIVPVVLVVVIPDQNKSGPSKVGSCAAALTCENGGANIMSSEGRCECLCVNGYTGSTCSSWQQIGCTTIATGSSTNATIGEALPDLLESADTDYNISLDTQELLGLFSSSNLSCNIQNQLVTFNGRNSKRSSVVRTAVRHPHQRIPRQEPYDEASSTSSDSTTSASATATLYPASASATPMVDDNDRILNFARVAVLYVFQSSQQLQAASDAQENLQMYLRTGSTTSQQTATAQNVTLGNGYSCDLSTSVIVANDGITVGGQRSPNED